MANCSTWDSSQGDLSHSELLGERQWGRSGVIGPVAKRCPVCKAHGGVGGRLDEHSSVAGLEGHSGSAGLQGLHRSGHSNMAVANCPRPSWPSQK